MAINVKLKDTINPQIPKTQLSLFERKVTAKERVFFTEQLSLLLENHSTLHESLQIIYNQTTSIKLKELISDLISEITNGKLFSQALAKHPAIFSQTYVNLVAASEKGGFMCEVLTELVNLDDKKDKLNNIIISTFAYPAVLSFFSVSVVIFVLVYIFPKFTTMFASIKGSLPLITLVLMWISNFVINNWILLILSFITVAGLIFYWLRSDSGKIFFDKVLLNTPLLRTICIKLYLVQSLRVMSLSLANSVSILDTLNATKEIINNTLYKQFILNVINDINEGASLADGFNKSQFIPVLVKQMVTTGEKSGHLAKVMSRIADYYERELNKTLNLVAKSLEPLMLIIMGGVVGLLVSALILPIFKLSSGG